MQKYGSKVTLAAIYENSQVRQRTFTQLTDPQEMFRTGFNIHWLSKFSCRNSSDIYAVGMVGIKALTGVAPCKLDRNTDGEIKWSDAYGGKLCSQVKDFLAKILSKMVLDDFKQRYEFASEALEDLKAFDDVINSQSRYLMLEDDSLINTLDQLNTPTKSCSETP